MCAPAARAVGPTSSCGGKLGANLANCCYRSSQHMHHHTLCLCSVLSLLFSHNLFCTDVCFTSLPASCGHSPLLPVPFLLLHSSPTHRSLLLYKYERHGLATTDRSVSQPSLAMPLNPPHCPSPAVKP